MIAMIAVFYLFLFFFGIIGSARGWAKELLVIISVLVALAIISLLENLLGLAKMLEKSPQILFYVRLSIVMIMTIFGYQSPKISRIARAAEKRDRIQDHLFGFILGIFSGYFVVGTLWSYASQAGYPMLGNFVAATPKDLTQITTQFLNLMPPMWLSDPKVAFIMVVIAFVFVIVYFV
jgi:uncharacterized membrane protein YfcA